MAITKSAKKAQSASLKKRVYNLRRADSMKDATKAFEKSKDPKMLAAAYAAIDKAAKRNLISKNTAARKKSKLARSLAK